MTSSAAGCSTESVEFAPESLHLAPELLDLFDEGEYRVADVRLAYSEHALWMRIDTDPPQRLHARAVADESGSRSLRLVPCDLDVVLHDVPSICAACDAAERIVGLATDVPSIPSGTSVAPSGDAA